MKNFKIILQYDGSRYNGWQKQGNTQNTIQEKLENILSRLVGYPVEVYGSGRTDAGTHAIAQTANFHIETKLTPYEVMNYINTYLPQDIAVVEISQENERFHSRLNARRKTYIYRLQKGNIPNVFERKYIAEYPFPLDVEKMKAAAEFMVGKHDFMGFCANKKTKKSTERTIYDIQINEYEKEIQFLVCGSGFLHHMVRIMVGTLCEIGAGKRDLKSIEEIFETKNRAIAGETLPAHGLSLLKVEY